MRKYKPYLLFLTLVVIGLIVVALISNGFYPVIMVNNNFVSARTFWKNYQAGQTYYLNMIKLYGPEDYKSLTSDSLKLSILTQLVENAIIEDAVEDEVGEDVGILVSGKIEEFRNDNRIKEESVQSLYGLDIGDFREEILIPLARQEVLAGRLFLQGKDFDEWLLEAKRSSSVKILSPQFFWDGEEVKIKSDQ